MSTAGPRHLTLDVLRGAAALAVCWYHFTNGNPDFLPPHSALKASGANGWMGVEVFFVISGFIIPFALARSRYRLADYGIFLAKRIIRLDPPYLVSIGVFLALVYVSSLIPGFRGAPFHLSVPQLLLHVGYLNVLFGYPWFNPVFWTLAIELQYYLLIGLIFPLLTAPQARVRWATLSLLGVSSFFLPATQFLCHWLVLFLLGIFTFYYRQKTLGVRVYLASLALLGAAAVHLYGAGVALVGVAAASVIAFVEISHPNPFVFLGHLSYSLYLLHVPIGGRLINLSLRFVHGTPGKFGVACAALASSLLGAWLLHRFVERPAQRWSSSIGYRQGRAAPSGFAPRQG